MNKTAKASVYFIFIIGAFISLFPFYWVFCLSTHNTNEIVVSFPFLPGTHLLENFIHLMRKGTFPRGFGNSCLISISSTFFTLFFSTMCGYSFAKYRFKGRAILFQIVLATMMIPMQIGLVAFVKIIRMIGLYNTYIPLIAQFGSAFGVFWMTQYIKAYVPDEMLEAARIEGLGELNLLLRIVMPVISPAIISYGIIYFVGSWNSYLMPLIVLQDTEKFTLPMTIAALQGRFELDLGMRYLALALATVPLLVLFLSFSRTVRESIVAGAVKG